MPSVRCRRSLTRSITAKSKGNTTGSKINDWLSQIQADPENRGRKTQREADQERGWMNRGMKRTLDSEDEENTESEVDPASPVKTVHSGYKRMCYNVTDEGPIALPVKSFYGSNKKQHVSPLSDVHNLHMKTVAYKPLAVVGTKRMSSNKPKSQSARRKAKLQRHQMKAKCVQKSVSPKGLAPSEAKRAEKVSSPKPDCTKKFFRYRAAQHSASMTVVMQKGFQLKFLPGRRLTSSGKSASKQNNTTKRGDQGKKNCSQKQVTSVRSKLAPVNRDMKRVTSETLPVSPDLFSESSQVDVCPGSNICLEDSRHDSGMSFCSYLTDGDTLNSCDKQSLCSNASVADSVLLLPTVLTPLHQTPNEDSVRPSPADPFLFPVFNASPKPASSVPSTPQGRSSRLSQLVAATPGSGSSTSSRRSPRHVLKTFKGKDGKEQMILDFGQKLIGAVHCEICGMTYTHGEPTDEATHAKFHQRLLHVLRFPGWKKECVVQKHMDGSRVVVVMPDDKLGMKKVESVKQIVDNDLGFVVEGKITKRNAKSYLYISADRRIVGCCIAEVASVGYRVIANADSTSQECLSSRARPWCCSTEPAPVKCGINRIWVLECERNKGIATKLLDSVRYTFLLGYPLKCTEIAFSDPTPDGKAFATRYTSTPSFLVYKPV